MARQKKADNGKHKKPIEQYEHRDKKRVNNPPVGLVTAATEPPKAEKKTYAYDPHLDPQLVWAGKAEHTSFEVPTVSLHVHERIDPRTIIEAVRKRNGNGQPVQGSLFESREENPPLREAIDFYKHPHNWSNRLIAGDSLLVMNSLLEKEGMAGQVQMVYMDPPYGIKYGSNFQPFVNERDVKDGKDEDLTQEPEMIRAFRDTWELDIHSYLNYLRDRLWLAKDLLHESGSCFIQISDKNLHLAHAVIEEVFEAKNFVSVISFSTTTGFESKALPRAGDYLIWYAKEQASVRFNSLYVPAKRALGEDGYRWVQFSDGSPRGLTAGEIRGDVPFPTGANLYKPDNIISQGGAREPQPFTYQDKSYEPPANSHWKANYPEGMDRLAAAKRLHVAKNSLQYVRYVDDFPWHDLNNVWTDTVTGQFTDPKLFVVQTNAKVVARCLLMTTNPGDLVFDPTCGSGTTASVAEEWGRRWITCDTSRVAVTLAKQRLATALYDYYDLAHPEEGVGSGFKYKRVPHVTLKSIANNPEIREGMTREQIDAAIRKYADEETLYDQPEVDKSRARVSGPFTVEAVPAPTVRSVSDIALPGTSPDAIGRAAGGEDAENAGLRTDEQDAGLKPGSTFAAVEPAQIRLDGTADPQQMRLASRPATADASVARSGETLRQSEWRDVLLQGGVRGKGGQTIVFSRVEPLGGTRWLHADAETVAPPGTSPDAIGRAAEARDAAYAGLKPGATERVVISFGPEYAPLEQRQVELAWEEARQLRPRPSILLFVYTDIDPEAGKDIGELTREKTGLTFLGAKIDADVWTKDLKKKARTSPSAWLVGQPDVEVRRAALQGGMSVAKGKPGAGLKHGAGLKPGATPGATGRSTKSRFVGLITSIRKRVLSNPGTHLKSRCGCWIRTMTGGVFFHARNSSPWQARRKVGRASPRNLKRKSIRN